MKAHSPYGTFPLSWWWTMRTRPQKIKLSIQVVPVFWLFGLWKFSFMDFTTLTRKLDKRNKIHSQWLYVERKHKEINTKCICFQLTFVDACIVDAVLRSASVSHIFPQPNTGMNHQKHNGLIFQHLYTVTNVLVI